MVAYLPSFTVQVSQIVMYPAYTAAYHAASEWIKVGLTVLFPILEYFLKRIIRRLSDLTLEVTEEVIVTGIEITAAIYQSMIMQSTPSVLVTIVTIGVDLVQGVLEVRHVMEKHSVIPQREIILAGLQFIDQWHPNSQWTDDRLRAYGSRSKSPLFALTPRATMTNLIDKRRVTAAMQQRDKIVLVHALEILQAAEKILLVEYIEVVIPFMNGVFLVVASQLDSAIYNVNIVGFYFHRERLAPALLSLFLYIALQSFVLMAFVMRVRFQLSPSVLLAFHLERHAWSIQGKMAAWLSCLLQFSVMHYGADFSFRFDFHTPTAQDT